MPGRDSIAIVDIGSNSVRLVVYSGTPRIQTPIFNEKVLAGLGAGLAETGELSDKSQERALAALCRYRLLLDHMRVKHIRAVATAAARDASNGPQFVRAIKRIGFNCLVLSAEDEAKLAAEGVMSAVLGADGIVGDLGGGSLELADVRGGAVRAAVSLPIGVLRVGSDASSESKAHKIIRSALKHSGLDKAAAGRPFYMVGGSWRALARMDMIATDFPLPVKHQYAMPPSRANALRRMVSSPDAEVKRAIVPARLATSPVAAMILVQLVKELEPSELILSSFGIREGLLYSKLGKSVRAQDPLIEAARDAGGAERRFGEHGDILDRWIGTIFDDSPAEARIRHASCLLADVAWQASPDFRADRAVEMALHGNWVGVDAAGRVMMAQALSSSFGHDGLPDTALERLCSQDELERARQWGLATRLAQRLSGGVGSVLKRTSLGIDNRALQLTVRRGEEALVGDTVERRLVRLAGMLGLEPVVVTG